MNSRRMRVLFWALFVCIVALAVLLFVERQRARDRVRDLADQTPIDAPYSDAEAVTLDLANDDEGSITADERQIALPSEVTGRARALLDHLVSEYALPGSAHPLAPGAMVNEIFLLPLPLIGHTVDPNSPATLEGRVQTIPVAPNPDSPQPRTVGGQLAVIDLRGSFVNNHPSGVEVESLTIASIIGTLHANLPQIEQVRFLVDGQPRETLAGHADLLRTYPVARHHHPEHRRLAVTEPTPATGGRVIGVFDSGFGGLTVLRALLPRLPGSHFIYLGDTARLPYGAKSQATVARYAIEAARFLVQRGAELLVIACNTATALALPAIQAAVPVPVIGVVQPGAQAALAAAQSKSGHPNGKDVLVLATAATVQSHAYRDTCTALGLRVEEMPCPLLVPLVEEGWTDHPVTREVIRIYLTEALATGQPKAVLLGCTHYPLIAPAITQRPERTRLRRHRRRLRRSHRRGRPQPPSRRSHPACAATTPATFECYATDSVEKFARLGTHFLGHPIPHVELLDLGG